MTVNDCLTLINQTEVDNTVATTLANIYGVDMPVGVEQIVSLFRMGGFVGDYRFLSLDEIQYAEDDLHVDFKSRKFIPLIDCGDNDFIVYDLKNKTWMRFNVVELVAFQKKMSLSDMLT